ncbi:MAG TPA: hypothetical protein VM925_32435 [Labilithrix sp.]|nr:hypothetical protein [Labilithrix sp.]
MLDRRGLLAIRAWALLLVTFAPAFGCRGTEVKPADTEVSVPKLPLDASSAVVGDDAATPAAKSTGNGWMVRPERGTNPVYTERAVVLEAIKKAAHRAVLVHDEVIEECSSTGGSHAFFTIVQPGKGVVHYGGHAAHLMNAFEKGQVWVAAIEPLASPESVKNEAWCVPDRKVDARATALVPVATREEGSRLLEELAR